MRVRHRIPSIFNLSMVDVLCCSLGCVILIWLINLRDSKQHEDESGARLRELTRQIAALEKDRAAVQSEADERAAALRDIGQKWKDAAGRVVALQADLTAPKRTWPTPAAVPTPSPASWPTPVGNCWPPRKRRPCAFRTWTMRPKS